VHAVSQPALQPGHVDAASDPELAGIQLVVTEAKDAIGKQLAQGAALDTKAGTALGSASFLTGIFIAFHNSSNALIKVETAAAVVFYIVVVGSAYLAYRTREYSFYNNPVGMTASLVNGAQAKDLQLQLLSNINDAYDQNSHLLSEKLRFTDRALGAFAIEVVIILAIAITQIFAT
jgi:hypothetical protein